MFPSCFRKSQSQFRWILPLLIVRFITPARAVCEHEQNEYRAWSQRCEELSAVANATGAVGGFFAIATFGISMAPAAAAIAAANNACRIRDEKLSNLNHYVQEQLRLEKEGIEAHYRSLLEQLEASRQKELNAGSGR